MPCYFWVVASRFLVNWLAGPHIFCTEDVFPNGRTIMMKAESRLRETALNSWWTKCRFMSCIFCKCSTFLWFLVEVDSRKNLLIIEHIAMDNCTFIDEKDDDLPIARWFSFIFRRIPFKITRRYNQSARLSMAWRINKYRSLPKNLHTLAINIMICIKNCIVYIYKYVYTYTVYIYIYNNNYSFYNWWHIAQDCRRKPITVMAPLDALGLRKKNPRITFVQVALRERDL